MVNDIPHHKPIIIGIGGAGVSIVNQLITPFRNNSGFLAIDSDDISLSHSTIQNNILIKVDKSDDSLIHISPIAERITQHENTNIKQILHDFNPIIITAGLGGKTGSYISQSVADISKKLGKIVMGLLIIPFYWEGIERLKTSDDALSEFRKITKLVITYSNELSMKYTQSPKGIQGNHELLLTITNSFFIKLFSFIEKERPTEEQIMGFLETEETQNRFALN